MLTTPKLKKCRCTSANKSTIYTKRFSRRSSRRHLLERIPQTRSGRRKMVMTDQCRARRRKPRLRPVVLVVFTKVAASVVSIRCENALFERRMQRFLVCKMYRDPRKRTTFAEMLTFVFVLQIVIGICSSRIEIRDHFCSSKRTSVKAVFFTRGPLAPPIRAGMDLAPASFAAAAGNAGQILADVFNIKFCQIFTLSNVFRGEDQIG